MSLSNVRPRGFEIRFFSWYSQISYARSSEFLEISLELRLVKSLITCLGNQFAQSEKTVTVSPKMLKYREHFLKIGKHFQILLNTSCYTYGALAERLTKLNCTFEFGCFIL